MTCAAHLPPDQAQFSEMGDRGTSKHAVDGARQERSRGRRMERLESGSQESTTLGVDKVFYGNIVHCTLRFG